VVAARLDDGDLAVFGRRPSAFIVEQWLRADADGRAPPDAVAALAGSARAIGSARFRPPDGDLSRPRCDALGCTAMLDDGRVLALVLDAAAFAEDCGRADIVVAPLFAPAGCAADIVIDRRRLETTGAQMLRLGDDSIRVTTARAVGEDRPWSPAPRRLPARAPPSHGPNDSSLATDDAEVAPFR
jgi:competence protein ComEC